MTKAASNWESRHTTQHRRGFRPRNNWGTGHLPAPWAEADLLHWPDDAPLPDGFMQRMTFGTKRVPGTPGAYIVDTAFSVDAGDGWYFRVSPVGHPKKVSDRLHVFYPDRSDGPNLNFMTPFILIRTADPDGLQLREQMLADGWPTPAEFTREQRCNQCGQIIPHWL